MKKNILCLFLLMLIITMRNEIDAKKVSKYNDKKIIITLKKTYTKNDAQKIEKTLGTKIKSYHKLKFGKNSYVIYTETKINNINAKLKKLNQISNFKQAQPSYIYSNKLPNRKNTTKAVSNDWHVKQSKADQLKNMVTTTSKKVKVGVIDTGIDYQHPAFAQSLDKKLSYQLGNKKQADDYDGHGSHVSGLIAANNKFSVGKNTEIVALGSEYFDTEDIVEAIFHAQKNNIKILNMSFGGDYFDALVYNAIEKYDGLAFVSAGNNDVQTFQYPASYDLDNIITIGAIEKNGGRAQFSSYNKETVDIFAPGQDIFSACSFKFESCLMDFDATYSVANMSGTSMATPIAAGIGATIYSQNPEMSMRELKNAIMDSAVKTKKLANTSVSDGYIDAVAAYKYSKEGMNNATHSAKLNNNGSLSLWGNNENGQLGNGNNSSLNEANAYNYQIANEKIVKYSLTKTNTYVISDKGNLYVTGKNDYNQLGQKNEGDSNKFVRFTKISNNHLVASLEFRNKFGSYDESSLIINLKSSSNIRQYYKLGKDSFKFESSSRVSTTGLQMVTISKGFRTNTVYYQPLTNTVNEIEQFKYDYDTFADFFNPFGSDYSYLKSKESKKYYNNYYIQKNYIHDYNGSFKYPFVEKINREIISKKTYKNVDISKTIRYYENEVREDFSSYMPVDRNNIDHILQDEVYTYKNGKKTKVIIKYYNNVSQLKSNSFSYAYHKVNNYSADSKLLSSYKAKYKANGKLDKNNLLYKAVYRKRDYEITKNTYNANMERTKYQKTIYNNKKQALKYQVINYNKKLKKTYLNRKLNKGIKVKEYLYHYNKKGQLKLTGKSNAYLIVREYKKGKLKKAYRYTYNKKGKKMNRKQIFPKLKGGK